MDFTYYVAFALSVVVGFASALAFILMRWRSYWRLVVIALLVSVAVDFALLLDWSHANDMTLGFLLTDAAVFAACGLVGCIIGSLPVVGLRGVYRLIRRSREDLP